MKRATVLLFLLLLTGCGTDMAVLSQDDASNEAVVLSQGSLETSVKADNEEVVYMKDWRTPLKDFKSVKITESHQNGDESVLVINLNDKEVEYNGIRHNYLTHETLEDGEVCTEPVEILDWDVLNFSSVVEPIELVLSEYLIPLGVEGYESGDYNYFQIPYHVDKSTLEGISVEEVKSGVLMYVFKNDILVSVNITVTYEVNGVSESCRKSLIFSDWE